MESSAIRGHTGPTALRIVVGILLCLVPLLAFVFGLLEDRLLHAGVLNTLDLAPVVGDETGTTSDYLLNVWHWDAASLLLFFAALPSMAVGLALLTRPPFNSSPRKPFH